MAKGKFIVLYGINNLGKTTQAKLLVEKLNLEAHPAKYLKYPLYDLEPSGPQINKYLRQGNPENLSAKDAQMLYAENRADYEPKLIKDLENGINIIAEDYWGTGVAWGMANGVRKELLMNINSKFISPDLSLLLVGERFTSGIEKNHAHEQHEELTKKAEEAHRQLGRELGWIEIDANGTIEGVSRAIWEEVAKIL